MEANYRSVPQGLCCPSEFNITRTFPKVQHFPRSLQKKKKESLIESGWVEALKVLWANPMLREGPTSDVDCSPSLVSPTNFLRLLSVPSSHSLMKTLNNLSPSTKPRVTAMEEEAEVCLPPLALFSGELTGTTGDLHPKPFSK